MESLIACNRYFFTTYFVINSNGDKRYETFRAKYLGKFSFNGGFGVSDIQYAGRTRMETCTMVTYMSKIDKIESLSDITNEILPNDILRQIDSYL
jgi:hypothetical protein